MDPNDPPTSANAPSISKEQALLESFFHALSQFAFDKARDRVEKEKDTKKLSLLASSPWSLMLISLLHLVSAEKTYFSLSFVVTPKKFFRKDSLRENYKNLIMELKRVEEHGMSLSGAGMEGGLLAELCRHLCQFAQARQEMMDFYESMATVGSSPNINYSDLVTMIDEISKRQTRGFHHPILDPLKSNFSCEVDIVCHLLKAECDMADWKFLPSLLHLHESHAKLSSWCQIMPTSAKELSSSVKKSFFSSTPKRQTEVPALYQWLAKLHAGLVSKFTLYFYTTLSEQTTPVEMKSLTARASVDYVARFSAFQRRSDAFNISLLLDARMLDTYRGHGYQVPDEGAELPSGVGSFPAIFSFPRPRPDDHWPNIVSIMFDKSRELSGMDSIIYFFDNRMQSTYFLTRVTPRLTLVIIFAAKKSEKDSNIIGFMNDISTLLRNTKIFALLKLGGKA